MRVVKYKTKLTEDRKVVLEKEVNMNRPDDVALFAREFLHDLYEYEKRNHFYFWCQVNLSKALLANAVSIIIMHNHPSGNPKPSVQDIESTK